MSEPIRERTIDINSEETEVTVRGHRGRIEFYGNLGEYAGYLKLRWRTLKFTDIDASEKDGALIEIDSGGRTPVEFVEADKTFSEVPLTGSLIFLHLDAQGIISLYHFDSKREKDKSFLFDVKKGELFCWVALNQEKTTKILEYEEPGFTESDLKLVDVGIKEISGKKIPDEYWKILEQLERGMTERVTIPIVELNSPP
jgi:hypothetical protein